MSQPDAHLISGTPAEAVKLAPVATAMRAGGHFEPIFVITDPDPDPTIETLATFALAPDVTLPANDPAGGKIELITDMVDRLEHLFGRRPPAVVLVHGDTPVCLAAALAAFWRRIPVVHLGAGLRPDGLAANVPQEADRRLVTQLATLHAAPTALAAMNLLDEGAAVDNILIAGDPGVDAALALARRRSPFQNAAVAAARPAGSNRRLVLVTAQRPELGEALLENVLSAVRTLVHWYDDIQVIVAGPADPAVRNPIGAMTSGVDRLTVAEALSYADLSRLLAEAYLVLTDSDSILTAAPTFGVPALALYDATERTECLHAGCARLVGGNAELILEEVAHLLESPARRKLMIGAGNPYGDGHAGARIAQATAALLGFAAMPEAMPGSAPPPTLAFGADA